MPIQVKLVKNGDNEYILEIRKTPEPASGSTLADVPTPVISSNESIVLNHTTTNIMIHNH